MSVTREKLLSVANDWLGKNEKDGSFKVIVDTYNDYFKNNGGKYPRGVKLDYKTAWCAGFVSAVAIKAGATDIIPLEISCGQMIEQAVKMGIWIEDDNYSPEAGDIILYDWQDSGVGDNKGWPDHVGYVASITKTTKNMSVIEGNNNNAVKIRKIKVGDRYIRGYIVPKYASAEAKPVEPAPAQKTEPVEQPANDVAVYTVVKGDTLSKIAKKYNVTVNQLVEWNGIKNPNLISIGQKIKLGPSASASTPAPGYPKYIVQVNTSLNIRSMPVIDATGLNIVGSLHNGDIVEVASVSNNWAQLADGRGYCCMSSKDCLYMIKV